jgi:Tol biopolymer transport system component
MRRDEQIHGDIWTLSVKDGALTQITDDPLPERFPRWSPDGKTIAYRKDDLSVWLVPAEGGTSRKIIDDVRRFSWSPDSKWLFYTTWQPRKHQFIRIADERVFDITLPEGIGTFISWSADGKLIFYRPSYDYTCILKVVSTSGGPSFQLGREFKLWPYTQFWSPDSKMIITRGGYPIEPKYIGDTSFWIIPLAGGDAFPLKIDVSVIGKPYPRSLSPDGKKLLFAVPQSDTTEDLYVAPVSLEDARTTGPAVKVFSGRDKKPVGYGKMDEWAWSPDGSKLAVIHGGDIWITSTEEGKPVRITNTPEHEIWLVWSPDGEMIAYMFLRGEEPILHIISVSGGEATKILDTSAGRDKYAWSPDGKEIAVISNGAISAIPIAAGKARQILALKHQGFVDDDASGLSWLPDGKHLAFVSLKATEDGNPTRIFMVPAEGGKVTELAADDDGWKNCLYPSPNGKWISYGSEGEVKTRSEGAIWEADFDEILKKASR